MVLSTTHLALQVLSWPTRPPLSEALQAPLYSRWCRRSQWWWQCTAGVCRQLALHSWTAGCSSATSCTMSSLGHLRKVGSSHHFFLLGSYSFYCAVHMGWPVATLASCWIVQTYPHWRRYWRNLLLHQLGEAHTAPVIQVSVPLQHMIKLHEFLCIVQSAKCCTHVMWTPGFCAVLPHLFTGMFCPLGCFLLSASGSDGLLCT